VSTFKDNINENETGIGQVILNYLVIFYKTKTPILKLLPLPSKPSFFEKAQAEETSQGSCNFNTFPIQCGGHLKSL